MIELWQSIAHGISLTGAAVIVTISSIFVPGETLVVTVPAQTAIAVETVTPVVVAPIPGSSTVVSQNLLPVIKLSKTPLKIAKPKSAAAQVQIQTVKPAPPSAHQPATPRISIPITAQSLLASTTISFTQTLDGSYEALLTGKNLTWNPDDATVGGGGTGIPQFNESYSCNPTPNIPVAGALDQHPSFKVRTSYDCTITLTPTTGTDLRAQSKDFIFQTGPGSLIATPSPTMNTTLLDGENDGGIVFTNQDSESVTIYNLTADISFTAINTSTPVVVRFADPNTGASLFDFHLENLPADPNLPYTQSENNVSIPLSFTIAANDQKMLVVQALGVHNLDFTGSNPTVSVTLEAISANPSDTKTIIRSPRLAWTCTPDIAPYNPFATSTPSQPCAH